MSLFQNFKLLKIIIAITFLCQLSFGQNNTKKHLVSLKKAAQYDLLQKRNFPQFTYQNANDANLTELRKMYNLDSVAGNGTDVQRAINLLHWMHNTVPHEDEYNLPVLNAKNIIETYKNKHIAQGCYPLSISMNEIFLSMGYKSRSVICFPEDFSKPDGGHVINVVYINSLKKWVWMDPQENAYLMDEKGLLLNIQEVRERLIAGKKLIINPEANYHNVKTTKEYYINDFMLPFMYRFTCPINSEYNSQTRTAGKVLEYVELLPAGSKIPPSDNFESHQKDGYEIITYHTNNPSLFWEKPE